MNRINYFVYFCLLIGAVLYAQDPFQGNWEGPFQTTDGGNSGVLTAQVIADSNQTYRALVSVVMSGMPGPKMPVPGKLEGDKAVFSARVNVGENLGGSYDVTAEIIAEKFNGKFSGYEAEGRFELKKIYKQSPTLGAQPPANAVVLYNGRNTNEWQHADAKPVTWTILADSSLEVVKGSILSKKEFGNQKLHIEFRTPLMADAKGQARGNSGVYLQGRYEVQVLDSFGLEGKDNECGGIYKIAAPKENACLPPTEWQTYDITFMAPKIDKSGKKIKDAIITVEHNGVLIHDKRELPVITGGAVKNNEVAKGPLMLQEHKNPVRFRNIWVLPL